MTREDIQPLLSRSRNECARHRPLKTVLWSLAIMVLISIFYSFTQAPLNLLYESRLCDRYYSIPERPLRILTSETLQVDCKIDPIQQELALFYNKQVLIDLVTGKYYLSMPELKSRWLICNIAFVGSTYTRGLSRRTFLKLNLMCLLLSQIWMYYCRMLYNSFFAY